MRKTIQILIIIVLGIYTSCTQSPDQQIVGKWKIEDIITEQKIPENQTENLNKVIEQTKATTLLVFKKDNSYQSTVYDQTQNGKWNISKDGTTLTVINDNGIEATSKILEISSKQLKIMSLEEDSRTTLTLIKQ